MKRFTAGQRVVFKRHDPSDFNKSWEVMRYDDDGKVALGGPGAFESMTYAAEDDLTEFTGVAP